MAALCCWGCSPRREIVRDIVPEKAPELELFQDRIALIRSADCDASAMQISAENWETICRDPLFSGKMINTDPRMLPCDLFYMTLASTSDLPITDISFSCISGTNELKALSAEELVKKASPVHSQLFIGNLLLFRRIVVRDYSFDRINYADDTIGYSFPFVVPGDTVCTFAAFPYLPPDIRKFTIRISYSHGGTKKKVDFRFVRTEHRAEEK